MKKIEPPCEKQNVFERAFNIEALHDWQTRATNRYGLSTYEVCLKCGKAQQRNKYGKHPDFIPCERLPEFDSQFDDKGKYIFK